MDDERRIVIELIQSADVKRLEARDDDAMQEVKRLRGEVEALRRAFYDFLEAFGNPRSKR